MRIVPRKQAVHDAPLIGLLAVAPNQIERLICHHFVVAAVVQVHWHARRLAGSPHAVADDGAIRFLQRNTRNAARYQNQKRSLGQFRIVVCEPQVRHDELAGNVRFVAAVLIGSAIEDAHVVDFSQLGSFAQHQRLHLLERRQRKYVRNRDHEELLPKPVTDMIRRVAVLRHLAHPAVRHEASNPTREKNGRESAPMTIPEVFSGRSRRPTRMTFGIMPGGDFPLRKIDGSPWRTLSQGAVCAQNARSEGGPYLRRPSLRFALHLVDQLEHLLLLAFQEMDDVLAAQTL